MLLGLLFGAVSIAACAAPAPTATATRPPAATSAQTATPTKRPVTKLQFAEATTTMIDTPLLVAVDRFFLEEGIDPEVILTGGGAKARAAVGAGDPPIGVGLAAEAIKGIAGGLPVVVIGSINFGNSNVIIMSKEAAQRKGVGENSPLADRFKALKGLTMAATTPGSGTDTLARYILSKAGLDPERDVQITYLSDYGPMVAAMEQGAIDVLVGAPPIALLPIAKGTGIMLLNLPRGDLPELAGLLFESLFVNKGWADAHTDTVVAVLRGMWRAHRLIQQDPNAAKTSLRKTFSDIEPDVFDRSFEVLKPSLAKEPTLTQQGIQLALENANEGRETPINLSFDQIATNRFVDEARRQLGL